jgi:type IV pilus assembly protein PilZ
MEYTEKRREHPRVDAAIEVRYKAAKDFLIEYSRNISKGGIFLATSNSLPAKSKVRLQFYLPNSSKEIKILGIVVYTITKEEGKRNGKVPGMGILFTDFSPRSRREIGDYIEGLLAEKDIIIEKRRQGPRFDARIKVGFKSDKAFLWEYSKDISKGGIFIKTANPMRLNSRVQLRLSLPGRSKEIYVVGEVIYIVKEDETGRTPGMGLQFVDFDKEAMNEIEEYLEELRNRKD